MRRKRKEDERATLESENNSSLRRKEWRAGFCFRLYREFIKPGRKHLARYWFVQYVVTYRPTSLALAKPVNTGKLK